MAVHFEAVKAFMRQTKDGYTLSLVIHPDEVPEELLRSFVGTRYMVALAEIGDDEKPVDKTKPPSRQGPVAQAGLLCRDPTFQNYIVDRVWGTEFAEHATNEMREREAANALCELVEISSRADLGRNDTAMERFNEVVRTYNLARSDL